MAQAQLALEHLPACVHRKRLHQPRRCGALCSWPWPRGTSSRMARPNVRISIGVGPAVGGPDPLAFKHDIGAAHLTHPFVGHADDRHLAHRRVAAQDRLHLGRIGVEPAHHEHVLQPVGDGDVPGRVQHADVPGVQPTFGVDGLGRTLGVAPVARHDVVAAYDDLPRLAGRHRLPVDHGLYLQARNGAPRRAGDDVGRIAAPAHGHRAGGLGQPVGGEHVVEAEVPAHSRGPTPPGPPRRRSPRAGARRGRTGTGPGGRAGTGRSSAVPAAR